MTKLTNDPALLSLVGQPDCSKRRRFSKRQRPLSMRRDWCPHCSAILKGTDGCPVSAVLSLEQGEKP